MLGRNYKMPLNNSFLPSCFIGCGAEFANADIVLFGAPFDGTVTYRPGSRFAPAQMRIESYGLETYSPYQDKDIEDYKICDAGDLDLPFGSKEKALDIIEQTVVDIIKAKKKSFMIGGEHLVTLPAVKAVHETYPDLCILHFDAHTDLREQYIGEPLSHSTVMRRVWDILGDEHIWQFGIRSGTREEFEWASEGHTSLNMFNLNGLEAATHEIGNRPVYVTIDLDVLDPSIFAGTGTPEAGGVTFNELVDAICTMRGLNIVGADVVELAPHYDASGVSTAVACKVLRELLVLG
jgi:agmatinase